MVYYCFMKGFFLSMKKGYIVPEPRPFKKWVVPIIISKIIQNNFHFNNFTKELYKVIAYNFVLDCISMWSVSVWRCLFSNIQPICTCVCSNSKHVVRSDLHLLHKRCPLHLPYFHTSAAWNSPKTLQSPEPHPYPTLQSELYTTRPNTNR